MEIFVIAERESFFDAFSAVAKAIQRLIMRRYKKRPQKGGLAMTKDATLKQSGKVLGILEGISREQMQIILGSGLLADIRDGNVANVNRDEFRKMLGLPSLNPPPEPLLGFIATVNISARTDKFIAKDFFEIDTSRKAKVKISYLGNKFKAQFLGKVEELQSKVTLRYSRLNKASADEPIIVELGGETKVETTLSNVAALMENQGNGGAGVLFTNGYANIFYVRDVNGVLCAVGVCWDDGGWCVSAFSVDRPSLWLDGRRVFSRNPSETLVS